MNNPNTNPKSKCQMSDKISMTNIQSNLNDPIAKLNYVVWDLGFGA